MRSVSLDFIAQQFLEQTDWHGSFLLASSTAVPAPRGGHGPLPGVQEGRPGLRARRRRAAPRELGGGACHARGLRTAKQRHGRLVEHRVDRRYSDAIVVEDISATSLSLCTFEYSRYASTFPQKVLGFSDLRVNGLARCI